MKSFEDLPIVSILVSGNQIYIVGSYHNIG